MAWKKKPTDAAVQATIYTRYSSYAQNDASIEQLVASWMIAYHAIVAGGDTPCHAMIHWISPGLMRPSKAMTVQWTNSIHVWP